MGACATTSTANDQDFATEELYSYVWLEGSGKCISAVAFKWSAPKGDCLNVVWKSVV